MTPIEFRNRLEAAARRTGLTASDLAVWFSRPRPTVRTWLTGQSRPSAQLRGEVWDELSQRLLWLERSARFPIPDSVFRKKSRKQYIVDAINHERVRSVRHEVVEPSSATGF